MQQRVGEKCRLTPLLAACPAPFATGSRRRESKGGLWDPCLSSPCRGVLRSREPWPGGGAAPGTPFSVVSVLSVVRDLGLVEGKPFDLFHAEHAKLLRETE
jgi:hypothetical protein